MRSHFLRFFATLLLVMLAGSALYAASGMGTGPPNPPCGTPPYPPCPIPIDGGLGLLAGAGAFFGSRKLLKKRNAGE